MSKRYETGTAREVFRNALVGAIQNATAFIDAYSGVGELSEEDRKAIAHAKAEIRDYRHMLQTNRS